MAKSGTQFVSFFSNGGAGATGAAQQCDGGMYMATCNSTGLDGTHTASIQVQNHNGDWVTVYSFTASGAQVLNLAEGQYRGLTTATAPTANYLEMASVPAN